MQSCHTLTHALAARKTHLPVKFHAENTPPLSPERAKLAKFYSARSKTIPPLPWQTFALPFSERQVAEFQIRVAVMNGFTALGIPVSETVG